MNPPAEVGRIEAIARRMADVEARLAEIERQLKLVSPAPESGAPAGSIDTTPPMQTAASTPSPQGELEFEVGQNWFAKIGIVVLAIGIGFTLSQPFPEVPPVLPSILGYVVTIGLFVFAWLWRDTFRLVSRYFRGAGMALLFFATVRLYFFGLVPVLSTASVAGRALLLVVAVVNLLIGLRRASPYLVTLALVCGFVAAVLVDSIWFALGVILALTVTLGWARVKYDWPALLLVGTPLVFGTYALWALNNPVLGHELKLVQEPFGAVWFLPLYAVVLAASSLLRRNHQVEDPPTAVAAMLNCTGYGIFLLHTLVASVPVFAVSHVVVALVFLGLAVAFWVREQSRVSTFIYAMTGYAALSAAIIKAVAPPEVFVWLSVQSVVVATTAIWFRSRLIVVANFLIFVGIVGGYLLLTERESGISIGFGIVALVSARILNWQKHRLELTTELMRNAYLCSAFVMFPYALYHLVPEAFVALSWIGMSLVYYLCNLAIRNPKYRWMGHGTLVLAVLYVLLVGISRLEPLYRNLSFLVLGSVLLVVSLVFSKIRARQRARLERDSASQRTELPAGSPSPAEPCD